MDKAAERKIFDAVISVPWASSVVASESPDFLCMQNEKAALGVEVTELFFDQSDARLRKIPNYFTLIEGGIYRHKDDIKNLPFETVTYHPEGGKPFPFRGLVRKAPRISERLTVLYDTIAKKVKRVPTYLKRASAVELIVVDSGGLFGFLKMEDFTKLLHDQNIRKCIAHSEFREVYLVLRDKEGQLQVIPTRVNLLAEAIIGFRHALKDLDPDQKKDLKVKEFLEMLAAYLRDRGFRGCQAIATETRVGVCADVALCVFGKKSNEFIARPPGSDPSELLKEKVEFVDPNRGLSQFKELSEKAETLPWRANIVVACRSKI